VLEVVVTGTGTPAPTPDRAGAGVLVLAGEWALQFDAGRATTMRLAAAEVPLASLDVLFVTHHHSDHLVGVPDLVMTRWITLADKPLPIYTPDGPGARLLGRLLDAWDEELDQRRRHAGRASVPIMDVHTFHGSDKPIVVWQRGEVTVRAVTVRHIEPSVAYRVDTPSGSVVVSGDTRVCPELEALASGADIAVHEICRRAPLVGTPFEFVADIHADSIDLGGLAARAKIGQLVLTHLVPPPLDDQDAEAFVTDVRAGGYDGAVHVGVDLLRVVVNSDSAAGDDSARSRG
jgi:ribonuclease Z